MAKRKFELPGIQDLSKEQEAVRALPKEGQHLIVGGPGTGKSVVALIRARRHQREGDDYLFLVFNHLLNQASIQLFGEGIASATWDAWFRKRLGELSGQPVPTLEANNGGYRPIDWSSVESIVTTLPDWDALQSPFLVIDEGQDMPREFYDALVGMGFDRFFVVADQNQQIRQENSSRKDIQDCLAIETDAIIELKQNYRNQHRVALLARAFYVGDPASPPPDLPASSRAGAPPLLYVYGEERWKEVGPGILRLADRDPRRLIGVITPNNRVRKRYLRALQSADVQLDNPPVPITTYHGDDRADVAFNEGGILVINAQACKGLEFDTVVLADIDEHWVPRHDLDIARRLFYVMVARAKERVFMFMKRDGHTDVELILPSDEDVLRRKEL